MNSRCSCLTGFTAAVAGAVCLIVGPVFAQAPAAGARSTTSEWTAPRTADGQPDLQGVWANNNVTPLERPEGPRGPHDADRRTRSQQLKSGRPSSSAASRPAFFWRSAVPGHPEGPETFKSVRHRTPATTTRSGWSTATGDNRTSLITDPPDGQIPALTPEARSAEPAPRVTAGALRATARKSSRSSERCINFGVPRIAAGYNSYFQIVQAPGYVAIMQRDGRTTRASSRSTAGRTLDRRIRPWNGDSRGHWEGDTLVVDTTNFSPKSDSAARTENLHLIERFTRVAPTSSNYEFTVEIRRPGRAPWTAMIPLKVEGRTDLRIRLPRGQRSDRRHAGRRPRARKKKPRRRSSPDEGQLRKRGGEEAHAHYTARRFVRALVLASPAGAESCRLPPRSRRDSTRRRRASSWRRCSRGRRRSPRTDMPPTVC